MTRALSAELQLDIKACLIKGESLTTISCKFGVSRSVISKYKKKWFPDTLCNHAGWPPIITQRSKYLVRRLLLNGSLLTAHDAHKKFLSLGYDLSYKTAINVLKSMNFFASIKKKKPMISNTNKQKRYKWAKKYQHWTIDDWKRVVFSDESKINIWGVRRLQILLDKTWRPIETTSYWCYSQAWWWPYHDLGLYDLLGTRICMSSVWW